MSTNPSRARRFAANTAEASSRSDAMLTIADPGIDKCVHQVRDDIRENDDFRNEDKHAANHWVVARRDRLVGQPAQARPAEDGLHQNETRDHSPNVQAEDGDYREHRIARSE